jgi:hypothetical protein
MAMEASAKGSIVVGVVASLRKLFRAGRLSDEQIAARLSPAAVELVEQKIEIGCWYPMAAFAELVDLEWEVAGKRDPEYARQSGGASAKRQFESQRYQQLDFAKRAGKADSREAIVRQAKLITTITATFYNFLDVRVGIDAARPNELSITYANAKLFIEPLRYSTEGYMNGINSMQGSKRQWTSERVTPDRIVFRLALPTRLSSSR